MMTKTDNTFFVEIIPTGYYFFGNERTFTTTQKDKYGAVVSNYFAESNLYPQQTALLGMLRHSLLILYNRLEASDVDKSEIIGDENFNVLKDSPYGIINNLSPLVVFKKSENKFLLPAGLDHQIYKEGKVMLDYTDVQVSGFNGSFTSTLPVLKHFRYKENLNNYLTDGTTIYTEKEIFKSVTKTGVDKDRIDEAFYKQTFKGLCKGYSFGLWVNFTDALDVSMLKDIIIPFGADQGLFKLKFHTDKENVLVDDTKATSFKKIVLLSDAWVEEDIFKKIAFGITAFTPFRFIDTPKNNFYKLGTGSKSKKYSLLQRGSVLYPKEGFDITNLNKPAMQRIGYNYFKLI